jgi:hypothetical protein
LAWPSPLRKAAQAADAISESIRHNPSALKPIVFTEIHLRLGATNDALRAVDQARH